MYRPRPPKKNFLSYFIPFMIIISIFTLIIYSFQSLILKKEYFKNTFATLIPGENGTQVMLSGSEDWSSVSKNIKLFKGDIIKTSSFASINLIGETKVNLDKGAIVLIDKLQSNNSSSQVKLTIPEGRVWLDIKRMINPKSLFEIKSGNLLLSTRNGIFSVNGNSVRVIKGSASAQFYEGKKVLGQIDIGVGQELILSDSDLNSLKIGTLPNVRAINDEFKLSSWYSLNYGNKRIVKDGLTTEDGFQKEILSGTGEVVKGEESKKENIKEIQKIKNESEEKDLTKEEVVVKKVEHKGEITLDIEDTNIEIFKNDIVNLFGKVPTGTHSVKVNNWKLGKFISGSTKYNYNGALKWGNIKEGENKYLVEVFDEDDIKFSEKEFTISLKIKEEPKEDEKEEVLETSTGETVDKKEAEKTEEGSEDEIVNSVSDETIQTIQTSLQITSHKEGEFVKILKGQSLEIKGIPSTGAASIKVGDYKLKSFKKGDKTFLFRIAEEWGNAKIGEKNKFEITSFDEEGKEIEVLNFSLFIED